MRQKLGQLLLSAGLIDDKALESALADQRRWGKPLGRTLVDLRLVREDDLVRVLGQQLGLPVVDLEAIDIPKSTLALVPVTMINQHHLLPIAVSGKFLDVAMSDPMNLGVIDELRIRTQLNIRCHLAGPAVIERAIARHFGTSAAIEHRSGPSRGRSTRSPDSIPLETSTVAGDLEQGPQITIAPRSRPPTRDLEIVALQERISRLEALVERDESVLRKLLALLIDKGIATRDEIVERLG